MARPSPSCKCWRLLPWRQSGACWTLTGAFLLLLLSVASFAEVTCHGISKCLPTSQPTILILIQIDTSLPRLPRS